MFAKRNKKVTNKKNIKPWLSHAQRAFLKLLMFVWFSFVMFNFAINNRYSWKEIKKNVV